MRYLRNDQKGCNAIVAQGHKRSTENATVVDSIPTWAKEIFLIFIAMLCAGYSVNLKKYEVLFFEDIYTK